MIYPSMFDIMQLFEKQRIHYRIDAFDPDVITITASVPGQLWEIQCFPDSEPDIEIFISDKPVTGIGSIEELRSISDPWAEKDE